MTQQSSEFKDQKRLINLIARLNDWQNGEGDAGDIVVIPLAGNARLALALRDNGDVVIQYASPE